MFANKYVCTVKTPVVDAWCIIVSHLLGNDTLRKSCVSCAKTPVVAAWCIIVSHFMGTVTFCKTTFWCNSNSLLPYLDAYCPGWMHSAWPGCILPRLDAFGRRMHLAWMHSAAPPRSGGPRGGVGPRRGAWGRGGSHSGAGPPNASSQGSRHPGQAECIQPWQYASK